MILRPFSHTPTNQPSSNTPCPTAFIALTGPPTNAVLSSCVSFFYRSTAKKDARGDHFREGGSLFSTNGELKHQTRLFFQPFKRNASSERIMMTGHSRQTSIERIVRYSLDLTIGGPVHAQLGGPVQGWYGFRIMRCATLPSTNHSRLLNLLIAFSSPRPVPSCPAILQLNNHGL